MLSQLISRFFTTLIAIYQQAISPMLPARCRYYPTCSEYSKLAISWHGPCRGALLSGRRIVSCHPWGGEGVDFVPLPLYHYTFYPFILASIETNANIKNMQLTLPHIGVYIDSISYTAKLNRAMASAQTTPTNISSTQSKACM